MNLAARLESFAEPMRTQAVRARPQRLRRHRIGQIEVKGFGRVLVDVIEDEDGGRGKAGP